jgi:hypothetical protein
MVALCVARTTGLKGPAPCPPKIRGFGITQQGSATSWNATGAVDDAGRLEAWGSTLITALEALQALAAQLVAQGAEETPPCGGGEQGHRHSHRTRWDQTPFMKPPRQPLCEGVERRASSQHGVAVDPQQLGHVQAGDLSPVHARPCMRSRTLPATELLRAATGTPLS